VTSGLRHRRLISGLILALALGGCETLPPDVLVKNGAIDKVEAAKPAGNDQVGEPCTYRQDNPPAGDVDAVRTHS
jgi:hypothetical protein